VISIAADGCGDWWIRGIGIVILLEEGYFLTEAKGWAEGGGFVGKRRGICTVVRSVALGGSARLD
jgi:hypothetical protein